MSIAENHGGIYQNLKLLRETNGQAECNLFCAMGLDYIYVDHGNDVAELIQAFESVKDSKKSSRCAYQYIKRKKVVRRQNNTKSSGISTDHFISRLESLCMRWKKKITQM